MAHKALASFSIVFLVLLVVPRGSLAGDIATYWGQDADEGSLLEACMSRHYKYINIGFLTQFGGRQSLRVNIDNHCSVNNCTSLGKEIQQCQDMGTKVLLSIGGPGTKYSLFSPEDARSVAKDLWNNFFQGDSDTRPFGDVNLDGVDFHIDQGNSNYWLDLAYALQEISSSKILLTAAPKCQETLLAPAIRSFKFDYVWFRFYNDSTCQYSDNENNLVKSWQQWESKIVSDKMFLGLPASPAAGEGYIDPNMLINFLPRIKASTKYAGLMLWNRKYDSIYSSSIGRYV